MRVDNQRHAAAALLPGTNCTGSWVGPTAGLGQMREISSPKGFDPRPVQSVKSRYTD
jgi:hypothetical protein